MEKCTFSICSVPFHSVCFPSFYQSVFFMDNHVVSYQYYIYMYIHATIAQSAVRETVKSKGLCFAFALWVSVTTQSSKLCFLKTGVVYTPLKGGVSSFLVSSEETYVSGWELRTASILVTKFVHFPKLLSVYSFQNGARCLDFLHCIIYTCTCTKVRSSRSQRNISEKVYPFTVPVKQVNGKHNILVYLFKNGVCRFRCRCIHVLLYIYL